MPINRYRCAACGVEADHAISVAQLDLGARPAHCGHLMEWVPQAAHHDLFPESFEVDVGHGPQRVRTLSELRQIESDSLRRVAAGEPGAQPLIFRDFSQNHSNRDANVFGSVAPPTSAFSTRDRHGRPFFRRREE
jgi:hypothetical protein